MKSINKHFILGAALILCFSIPAFAYKPVKPPEAGPVITAAPSSDPFVRGLKNLRKITVDDLFDASQDASTRIPKIKISANAGVESADRINKRLAAFHSQVRIIRIDRDKLGLLHVRLRQYHRRVPVIGSDMIVHINKSSEVFAVTGNLAPVMDIDTVTQIRRDQAQLTAQKSIQNGLRAAKDSSGLVIFDGALAFEVTVKGSGNGPELYNCYIDARSGALLYKQSLIMPAGPSNSGDHEPVSGTRLAGEGGNVVSITGWHDFGGNYFFYNKDSVWGVFNLVTNDWEQRPTNSWGTSDPAAVSLAKNFSIIQNYVRQVDGINSFNNAGMFAQANVHEGTNYVNAYWDGADFHFGNGDGIESGPLTVLDVAAHEYGHAITQYTSNLNYSYESGALNESFSDIHGTLVEFWAEPDGRASYPNKTVGAADWLCGEDCWLSGVALRDLRNPQRFGQPSYYMGTLWYTGGGDNGGVHYNSGVQNFAFYLLSEGGTSTNDGHPYSITGLGIQHAGEIAMYANMHLLTSTAQYRDTRDAWIMAASILGYNATTVADVWTACGVLPLVKHLAAAPASLAFDSVGVGSSDTLILTLSNNGASSTIVSALSLSDPWFTAASTAPFTVPGGGVYALKLVCQPTAYAARSATLTITSNADDNPLISVSLSARGVAPAAIALTPSSLHNTVLAGDSVLQNVMCSNTGSAPLKIRIAKTEIDTPVATWKGEQRWNYTPSAETGHDFVTYLPAKANSESVIMTSPFFDGFEQGNYNNWTSGSGSYSRSATSATAASGQYSFTQIGGADVHFDGVNATLATPQQPEWVSFSIRAQSNNLSHAYFVMCGAGFADVIWFFMRRSGYLYVNANETYPYSANTWYNIRFHLNWATAAFDFYVNNVLIASTIPFRTNTPITTIYLYNYDNSQAWWDNINFNGASPNSWLSTAVDTATIFSGQSLPVPVWMKSTGLTGGSYFGSLSVTHNVPAVSSPVTIPCTLSVMGIRRLSVSPGSYNFGNVWAGGRASASFMLKNSGTEATRVDSLIFSSPAFSQTVSLPLTVRANDSARITVSFSPVAIGPLAEAMTVKSTAQDNPVLSVNLLGNGTSPPVAQVSPATLVFSLPSTSTPMSQISALSNIGGDTLVYSITSAEVSRPSQGSAGLAWLSVIPTNGVLSPGSLQNLTITVNPAGCAAGVWSGVVRVASNDPVNPLVTIAVTANISGCKKLSADKTSMDFGAIWAGTGKQLSLLLSNSCNDSVTISSLSFTNPAFATSAVCPFKVPAFGSVSISVGFAPLDSGAYAGNLTIQSEAQDNPVLSVGLSGRATTPPSLSIDPATITKNLSANDSAGQLLTLTNAGGDYLHYHTAINLFAPRAIVPVEALPLRIVETGPPENKISGPQPAVPLNIYSGQYLSYLITTYGEIMPFQYPIGTEHLQVGTYLSGYTVAYMLSGVDKVAYAVNSARSGIVARSYRDIVNDSFKSIVEVVTGTSDSVLEIRQTFTYYKNNRYIKVDAEIKNTSSSPVTNVVFKSDVDWDVDNTYSNDTFNYDPAHNMIYAYDRHYCAVAGASTPDFRDMDGWDDNTRRATDGDYINGPVAIDGLEILHYELGNLAPGALQKRTLVYAAADNLTQLQNTVDATLQGNTWLSVNSDSGTIAPFSSMQNLANLKSIGLVAGKYTGAIAYSHNSPALPNPMVVSCTLTVTSSRRLAISPANIDFGKRWIGSSTPLTMTLSNSGNDSTTVTSMLCNDSAFSYSPNLPLVVPSFGSKTVSVIFAPRVVGAKIDSFAIASNADDNPVLKLAVNGAGIVPPTITVSPGGFHDVLNANSSDIKNMVISNLGQDTLRFQLSESLSWLSESALSGSVAPGISSTIALAFNSSGMLAGSYNGVLLLTHNDPNRTSPLAIPCTLDVNTVRHCIATPGSLTFGTVHIGSQASQTITLSNSGNSAATISAITGGSSAFSPNVTLPLIIPAFGSATFMVTFSPQVSGIATGALVLAGNALENPLTIPLNGTGVEPQHITVSPTSLSETLLTGTTTNKTLTIANTGGDILHFTATAIDLSNTVKSASALYGAAHFAILQKEDVDTRAGLPVTTMSGGPDAFGYRWKDSDDPSGPVFAWDEISASGTLLSSVSSCDDCYQSQALSFPFPFYGNNFSSIYVSSNGCITLGTPNAAYVNYPLPSTGAPVNLIAGFWDDLYTSGIGDVYCKDYGDHAIVQYNNVPFLNGTGSLTFQIVLNRDGAILYYYKTMVGTLTSATVGIQNQSATTGLTIAYNAAYIKNNLAIKISKGPTWLGVNTAAGSISPGTTFPVTVTLDATQLVGGTYSGILRFAHDDPARTSPIDVPISLLVTQTASGEISWITSIGISTLPAALGTLYQMRDIRIGSPVSGSARGVRYSVMLR
jgi:Zn-dependent metalloprotease